MDLETVIHSEVTQKEENKYHILMHICGIQKHGIDDLICKTETERCREQAYGHKRGKWVRWDELRDWG